MHHLNLKNKLETQISSYIDYQKTTTRAKSIKLSKEIARLSQIIESIDMMPYPVQKRQIDFTIEHKKSKLNFQPTETTDMRNQKRLPPEKQRPIFEEAKDSRNRALQLAGEHKDIKPIRYLLKN